VGGVGRGEQGWGRVITAVQCCCQRLLTCSPVQWDCRCDCVRRPGIFMQTCDCALLLLLLLPPLQLWGILLCCCCHDSTVLLLLDVVRGGLLILLLLTLLTCSFHDTHVLRCPSQDSKCVLAQALGSTDTLRTAVYPEHCCAPRAP
jgi:hypothetical protein